MRRNVPKRKEGKESLVTAKMLQAAFSVGVLSFVLLALFFKVNRMLTSGSFLKQK